MTLDLLARFSHLLPVRDGVAAPDPAPDVAILTTEYLLPRIEHSTRVHLCWHGVVNCRFCYQGGT